MAFDEHLGDRIRTVLGPRRDISERRMFGGLAFLVNGNMFIGIAGADLMVRVGPDEHEKALSRPHARPMDFTGRPMKGYVYVAPAGVRTSKTLDKWIKAGLSFAQSLPAKKSKKL